MSSSTPNLGLNKPDEGDTDWASEVNANWDVLDTAMVPVGAIIAWHKTFTNTPSLPGNFLECNGQTVSDADSPYNGQTLPNLNGDERFLRGGSTSGSEQSDSTALPDTDFTTGYQDTSHTHDHNHGSVNSGNQSASHTHSHTHGNVTSGNQSQDHQHWSPRGANSGSYIGWEALINRNIIDSTKTKVNDTDHTHTTNIPAKTSDSESANHTHAVDLPNMTSGNQSASHGHTVSGGGDSETRPVNMSVVWIIRIK